jgi:hypothetical protein
MANLASLVIVSAVLESLCGHNDSSILIIINDTQRMAVNMKAREINIRHVQVRVVMLDY